MALDTIAAALASDALFDRIRASALKSAGVILVEGSSPNHANRLRWAKRVLSATGNTFLLESVERFRRYALATDAAIQAAGVAATDAQIDATVTAILADAAVLAFVSETAAESAF